jgi:predicted CXXCH cytochrome family protein
MCRWTFHRRFFNKKGRITQISVLSILVLFILLVDCSPKVGSNLLNFLVDGVPEKKNKDSVVTSVAIVSDSIKDISQTAIQPPAPEVYYHAPYKERACSKCHTAETPGKINTSQEKICYSCHDDFKNTFSTIHGPVAGGFCTACHAPHVSDNKNMLIRSGQDICLKCHSQEQVMANIVHAKIGKDDCRECHDPHGGNDHFILKLVKN